MILKEKITHSAFFNKLFKTRKRSAVLWISLLFLLLFKIYEGDQSYFVKHFSDLAVDHQTFLWLKWLWHHSGSFVFMFLLPVFIILVLLKEPLKEFGLTAGDYKFGLKATLGALVIMPFIVYQNAQDPAHAEYYQNNLPLELINSSTPYFLLWGLTYLPHYLGWEFLFRGYVGLGFRKEIGLFGAFILQILLTVLMHIGKPQGETWGTVFGGIYLGLLTIRTGSIWYAVIFHLYIGLLNSYFCFW